MASEDETPVGYGRPPDATRFQKGRSGNPHGRPRNRHRGIPHDAILGQMVTVREDGRERRITAAEAFLLQLTRKGLAGDSAAARASLEAIEKARTVRSAPAYRPMKLVWSIVGDGIDCILEPLGIARRKYPTDKHRVRFELQPWVIEAALARFGKRRLTETEQREVWDNTRCPEKVNWPGWWTVRG